MSDLQRISELEDQKSELEALIKESEEDGDIVGQLNFAKRLEVISSKIALLTLFRQQWPE